jgi:hypothetical protein
MESVGAERDPKLCSEIIWRPRTPAPVRRRSAAMAASTAATLSAELGTELHGIAELWWKLEAQAHGRWHRAVRAKEVPRTGRVQRPLTE